MHILPEMESCADRYLHKKFKKQVNNDSFSLQVNTKTSSSSNNQTDPAQSDGQLVEKEKTVVQQDKCNNLEVQDNKESVPNLSTNQKCFNTASAVDASNLSFVESSISTLNLVNLAKYEEKLCKQEILPQSLNNCISYARLGNSIESEGHISSASSETTKSDVKVLSSSILNSSVYKDTKAANTVSTEKIECKLNKQNETKIVSKPNEVSEQQIVTSEKSAGGKYVCNYCNLICSKPSVLQKHIRAHTNERPYPCDSCGFRFKTRSNLYKHRRSRSHVNRVLGNKSQELNSELNDDNHKMDQQKLINVQSETPITPGNISFSKMDAQKDESIHAIKPKPYKPRFHTAKTFFDNIAKENLQQVNVSKEVIQNNQGNSNLLSLHITNLINKNNTIVNTNDNQLLRKKSFDSNDVLNNSDMALKIIDNKVNEDVLFLNNQKSGDEPLNLTKNRKRSMSEVSEPIVQKSLIKELLLKNLYADTNMQCPHCKMIFQTVTELELHKLRSCKGITKTGAKYSRSSSVNVASILTHNKNAFDNIPQFQNSVFALKSPGPFLGNTRLVDNDKRLFSFEESTKPNSVQSENEPFKITSPQVSPLNFQHESSKKSTVKLFGGEVKVANTLYENKNFRYETKDSINVSSDVNYISKINENRVIVKSLQSGGTVLEGKPDYVTRTSPEVSNYEQKTSSPSKQLYLKQSSENNLKEISSHSGELRNITSENTNSSLYKYTNIMDFSQKAVKLLAPNLKQLNLTIPGVPVPNQLNLQHSPVLNAKRELNYELLSPRSGYKCDLNPNLSEQKFEGFSGKYLSPQQKDSSVAFHSNFNTNLYNPMNLVVNGKVVRHVPGIPGPVVAEDPINVCRINTNPLSDLIQKPSIKITPPTAPKNEYLISKNIEINKNLEITKNEEINKNFENNKNLEINKNVEIAKSLESVSPYFGRKTDSLEVRSNFQKTIGMQKSPSSETSVETPKKFTRPTSLALKPSLSSMKQHHGLTPTVFNQILISPDTPRVAKKYIQHYLHGNYFSYLGLKSSTKPVYCTLNKTQPFYVLHFKKLSMYSEWRQQDTKVDKLHISAYDSRQKQQKYTTAGKISADLVVHSSYKFTVSESSNKQDQSKSTTVVGGYESNEDYTYVRGRGRGRYVCDQCGIRCKKPSMLKKHIRTHSNVRPYTCNHCNFSFKTKGNLTKHLKSKSHSRNSAASSGSNSSAAPSGTPSSDSDTEDSGMDSSDESTRQHEAAYGLLSLAQKSSNISTTSQIEEGSLNNLTSVDLNNSASAPQETINFMNNEQVVHVNKKNYAKNKILDDQQSINISATIDLNKLPSNSPVDSPELYNITQFLGKTNRNRVLTYPYTSPLANSECSRISDNFKDEVPTERKLPSNINQFHVIKKYDKSADLNRGSDLIMTTTYNKVVSTTVVSLSSYNKILESPLKPEFNQSIISVTQLEVDNVSSNIKRKLPFDEMETSKVQRIVDEEVMDLSISTSKHRPQTPPQNLKFNSKIYSESSILERNYKNSFSEEENVENPLVLYNNQYNRTPEKIFNSEPINTLQTNRNKEHQNLSYIIPESDEYVKTVKNITPLEYDNSAMETLADIATKQVKLEKNSLAKNVASEFLKLATKNEFPTGENLREHMTKDVNELIVKSEENKSCTICAKNFSKPSQLRLHMNIHYLERPFRCDSCSVSFRTKGHLQKHERSASHHNKLSSSPAMSSSEPRPFKCSDCSIAFRIHGHLAKHLRSKMHIMKLECLAKIPFGLYAELERSNSLLTEINTADGNQCLESLKMLAKKVFINDPNKLNQLETSSDIIETGS